MSSTLTTAAVDPKILLEAGTNEVEILVFKVAGRPCGVNVAKVREVRTHQAPTALPLAPRAMSGVVRVRDAVVPLVNLRQLLWGQADEGGNDQTDEHLFLEFNNQMLAFRVQGVDRIYRISWKSLIPLPHCPGMNAPVTGVVLLGGQIVTILDFEAIAGFLGMNGTPPTADVSATVSNAATTHPPIVFADDSTLIRRMLDDSLKHAGYQRRQGFADGQEA